MKRVGLDSRLRNAPAFTLVEMLVAMTITVLLFSFVVQIVSLTSRAFSDDRKRMDAWDQARVVFDRIGFDWNARVRSPQVPSFIVKPQSAGEGDDAFALVTATPSSSGTRLFSVVQYEMDPTDASDGKTLALQRGTLGFCFSGDATPDGNPTDILHPSGFFSKSSNPAPLTFAPPSGASPGSTEFQSLGDAVIAVQVSVLTTGYTNTASAWVPASLSDRPSQLPANPNWPPNGWSSSAQAAGANVVDLTSTNLAAIVVGVAVLDVGSRKLLTDSQFSSLVARFHIPGGSTVTPVAYWQQNVLTDAFYQNVPTKAYQAVKVYQRFYYTQ